MDKNKRENLINKNNKKESIELAEISKDKLYPENEEEEIPKEVLMNYLNQKKDENTHNVYNNYKTKKSFVNDIISDMGEPLGKKAMETFLLNLNSYWLELLGSIGLILSVLIFELIVFASLLILVPLFKLELDIDTLSVGFKFIYKSIGFKWIIFIIIDEHLSVGFFCLTTFSDVFHETMNIKKFFILNIIKIFLFYLLSIIILRGIIRNSIGGFLHNKINDTVHEDKERIHNIFDYLIDEIILIVSNFLSTYNTFLDKLTLGSLYLFLFHEDKIKSRKKTICLRFMTLVPIIYIIASLVLRALQNTEKLKISELLSPLLLGPKVVVYLFFISTLLIIKYRSLSYDVFDLDNYIEPKVFSFIGSKTFGILGIVELIIRLFFPSWVPIGIGGKYLLVLCAPIVALYDYKKKYEIKYPCCKKKDCSFCLKIFINVIGYFLITVFGTIVFVLTYGFLSEYFTTILELMIDHLDLVAEIIVSFS